MTDGGAVSTHPILECFPGVSAMKSSCLSAYGTALALAFLALTGSAAAKSDKILHSFGGGSDGANPYAGVISDRSGNLYGTTYTGGSSNCSGAGCGTVFKVTHDGTETVLYPFTGGNDGEGPYAGVIEDKSGNLYGTAVYGGSYGDGTVFELAPDGTFTVLHTFLGGSNDGALPEAGLIEDRAGNLYGTAIYGGAENEGIVYEIASDGTFTILYSFKGYSAGDGANPTAALIRDSAGNFYGTTEQGGTDERGTVFELASDGTETVLHSFTGGSDGAYSRGGVVRDKSGNLYGATINGGGSGTGCGGQGCGTVFMVTPNGTESVLYALCSLANCADGAVSQTGVVEDSAGNLYGITTIGGGTGCGGSGCGTVFKLSSKGSETVLHTFAGGSDGYAPFGTLLLGKHGKLYGTTYSGGNTDCSGSGCGTVFTLKK
jgi:uncharacterized repeat protein (TIGR03803 family)